MPHLHPSDPGFLAFKLGKLRFELEHGRQPDADEILTIVQIKTGLEGETAQSFLEAAQRTEELEQIARDIVKEALPTLFGGVFAHMANRI